MTTDFSNMVESWRQAKLEIKGAKGATKPPAQYVPVEAAVSLRSKARGRILDLLAHGPIVGLVNGLQSIELDDTPLQNADGTFNFNGVTIQTREGYPDQAYIPGFTAVENAREISSEVKFTTPLVRSVTNNDANAVIITVAVQGLSEQKDNGDLLGYQVAYNVDVRSAGGAWVNSVSDTIIGMTRSPYQRSVRVPLKGTGPFDIRVSRVAPESTSSKISDDLYWALMTEVIDARLSYPDSALVAIDVDAELFGSKMPSRSYDVKLSIIRVPSNYDPITRSYSGFWDGSFKLAWTDNPAWCFYDLSTHPIIGANNPDVDKWSLYRIAQFCDGLVPDGYGGMEPRFTCNTLFASREEAITTLNVLASVFRGMVYWGSDSVVPVADMPGDAIKLVTPANVTSDGFEYTGTSLRERHSVAVVMWNDPADNYKQVPELYEDPESIQLYGWRETQVTAACCTSRGQARRLAKWILYSERMETEVVSYTATADHADLRPGDYIKLSDPDRAGARAGGRVLDGTNKILTLDAVPAEAATGTWYLSCLMPSGVIEQREVQSIAGKVVTLKTAYPEVPIKGAMWILSSAALNTPMYRVTAVVEQEDGLTYQITATEHDPNKYAFVEFDLQLPDNPTSTIPSGPLPAPTHISASSFKYIAGGAEHQGLTVSWRGVDDVRCNGYIVEARDPNDVSYRTIYSGPELNVVQKDIVDGEWMFRIKATTSTGRTSEWAMLTVNIAGLLLPSPPDSIEVEAATFSIRLNPQSIYPGAFYEFWRSDVALSLNQVESNAIRRGIATSFVDTKLKPDTQYYYYVRGTNIYGVSSFVPVQAKTIRDFDDIIAAMEEDIRKPGGLFEEMVESVTPGISAAQDKADQAVEDAAAALKAAQDLVPRLEVTEDGFTDLLLSDSDQSIKLAAVRTTTEGFSALVSAESATRVLDDGALGSRIDEITVTAGQHTAAIHENSLAIATNESTLAGRTTLLETNYNTLTTTITARIGIEETTRSTQTEALASRVGTLEASVGENIKARVTHLETTLATETEAIATQVTTLSSTMNQQFATISQTYSTQAYTDGAVARAVTTVTVNGRKAVFGISVNNEVAEIGAIADRFYIYNPYAGDYTLAFAVEGGVTVIRDALIRNASITMAKIAGALQSDNYVPGTTGWRLTKSGVFEINGSSVGQGQLVQTNQTISVYDATGNLRVQLGQLG